MDIIRYDGRIFQNMKQVIMLHSPSRRLQPNRTYSRGQVFTLLPKEQALVCIKVKPRHQDFFPQELYQPPMSKTLCYMVSNTTQNLLVFRNSSLQSLLSYKGVEHKITFLHSKLIIKLHQRWLRGYRVWYKLRKMFVMSQHTL